MFAKEVNASNIHQGVLFRQDDLLIVFPVLTAPVSCWGYQFFVFNLDDFTEQGQTCDVKVFAHAFWIQQTHETWNDWVVAHVLETFSVERIVVGFGNIRHDRVDSLINVGHPKDKYFELTLFLLDHVGAKSQLDQLGAKLSTFLTTFIFFSIE